MSRNLTQTNCAECPGGPDHIVLEGPIRTVTANEDPYYRDHAGLLIAEARCVLCHTLYFAWVDWPSSPHSWWHLKTKDEGARFCDLSYRHSFDDEPNAADLPVYDVQAVITYQRTPAKEHPYMRTASTPSRARYEARRLATLDAKLGVIDEIATLHKSADKP